MAKGRRRRGTGTAVYGSATAAARGLIHTLCDILNWRRVNNRLTLSGQPTRKQLAGLARSGVGAVINLAPLESPKALQSEAEDLATLGLAYVHIPVDFDNPTEADYCAFCKTMVEFADQTLHVHCIYNARATAFMLRHARDGLGGSAPDIADMMDGIWRPGGVWATFLGDVANAGEPSRYAGHDY